MGQKGSGIFWNMPQFGEGTIHFLVSTAALNTPLPRSFSGHWPVHQVWRTVPRKCAINHQHQLLQSLNGYRIVSWRVRDYEDNICCQHVPHELRPGMKPPPGHLSRSTLCGAEKFPEAESSANMPNVSHEVQLPSGVTITSHLCRLLSCIYERKLTHTSRRLVILSAIFLITYKSWN